MLKNKKANIMFELGDGVVNLIIWVVAILISLAFLSGVNTAFTASDVVTTPAKSFISDSFSTLTSIFNIVLPLLFFILIYLSVKFIRGMEDSKIITFLFFIILIGYFGTLMMLPANITESLSTSSPLVATALSNMPILAYMLSNSLFFGILYFAITGIALITRDRP